ncbi:MAG: hypothetical protein WAP03_20325 [Methylorubrum rhodinum]|uniref:hypothetical protein n=1 Tax=Methylorubrum rhodinum TaxID=29428 RepID=UPI003BB14B48
MNTPSYGVVMRMGVPAYQPEVCIFIDPQGTAFTLRPHEAPHSPKLIIIEAEGDQPTEKQLHTLECMYAILALHYQISALHLCPAILPHLTRIRVGKAHAQKQLPKAQSQA